MIEEVQSHYEEAKPFILEQYKEAAKWNACLKAVLDQYDDVENYAWNIAFITDLLGLSGDAPTGGKLDYIGGLVGLSRNTGELDSDYYARLIDYINTNDSGTIEGILKRVISIVKTNEVTYIEENSGFPFSASGLIITLSERQITRAEANRIKAAGTRLFVGGFLTTHDGIVLSTNSGHLLACAGGPYDTIEIVDGAIHVWDGTRDYSFFNTGASTWYIDTPEKWAGLCMISLGMDVADGSGLSNAKTTMASKNIEVTEDLYFNENYTENFTWETTYQNDSEKDILNNFAYVLRADGQRVALYFEAYCQSFNGNFHKIVGMYASSYSPTRWHPGIITDPRYNVKNISFEYCTLKNGMTRGTDLENYKSNYFPSLIYDDQNNATYKNIRAFHCKTIGVCTGGYQGKVFLIGSSGSWGTSGIMHNLSVQNCQAMLNFSSSYYYDRSEHAFVHNDSKNKNYKFIHTFENENLVTSQPLRNAYQIYIPYVNSPIPPASESFVYTFGNIGTTTEHETSILQTMSSKAALIAQVNADITANASGDLSLLDENGNFTGVCP